MTTAENGIGRIDLYWIPLGAGGSGFVRLNGRIYEAVKSRLGGRKPSALYHTALQVHVPEGRFVIETMWPSPDLDTASRGVVLEGPVGCRRLAQWRTFRYEVRRWRNGVLPDADYAVDGPQMISDDAGQAHRLLELAASVPALTWGRDQLRTGDMWNSNSVISWLLARSGLPMEEIRPPDGGRAPGWDAGVAIAATRHRHEAADPPGLPQRPLHRSDLQRRLTVAVNGAESVTLPNPPDAYTGPSTPPN